MLSINQRKRIRSLHQKKLRDQSGLFLAEGNKLIRDLLVCGSITSENTDLLCCTSDWLEINRKIIRLDPALIVETDPEELKKVTTLVTPPDVIAVLSKPECRFSTDLLREDIVLVFESIRDPGNLGTIIRTADWFGIKALICSPDSVDTYNSKVIQASMGAIMRVGVHYMEMDELFEMASRFKIPVYGTTMDGEDLYDTPVKIPSLMVFGNESKGISDHLKTSFKQQIRIPDFPLKQAGTESLNIASSVAVVCSEIRRRSR